LGLGGAAVVTVYKRADGKKNALVRDVERVSRSGYNPAVEARGITVADIAKIVSPTQFSEWMVVAEKKVQASL
jgi:sterol carrier protein 2